MFKKFSRASTVKLFKMLARFGCDPPECIFRHLHFNGPFIIEFPNGCKIQLNSWGNRVENELAWRGWDGHEPYERSRWLEILDGGDVLDIGANTGTFAFMAKAIFPESRVFAFEPISRIADRIHENNVTSGLSVEVVRAGVSQSGGELPIYDPGGANCYSASLEADFLDAEKESYNVPVVTVDDFCSEKGLNPSAIKIDVEGSEGKVLLGAKKCIEKRKVKILCEWLGNSDSHVEAVKLLQCNGYVALNVEDYTDFNLETNKEYEDRNVLLVPEESVLNLRSGEKG